MISNHIRDIQTAISALPNSPHKNKALSHVLDALAHVLVLESTMNASNGGGTSKNFNVVKDCTCRPGMLDVNCPVHGVKAS